MLVRASDKTIEKDNEFYDDEDLSDDKRNEHKATSEPSSVKSPGTLLYPLPRSNFIPIERAASPKKSAAAESSSETVE